MDGGRRVARGVGITGVDFFPLPNSRKNPVVEDKLKGGRIEAYNGTAQVDCRPYIPYQRLRGCNSLLSDS